MKNFRGLLREHAMKIIIFKKKKMKLLTEFRESFTFVKKNLKVNI